MLQKISHIKNEHWPFTTYIYVSTICYTEHNSCFVTKDYLLGTKIYLYIFYIKNVEYNKLTKQEFIWLRTILKTTNIIKIWYLKFEDIVSFQFVYFI